MREVLSDIEGARDIPELVVINKADAADPVVLAQLTAREKHTVVVSARTGAGMDELMAIIERELPRFDQEIRLLVPYQRGDLISRAHKEGEVLDVEHTEEGTILHARVLPSLFAELEKTSKPVETVEAV